MTNQEQLRHCACVLLLLALTLMKLDTKLTQAIQDWINAPEDTRDIKVGADLMLSLNRNRALYNSVLRNPVKYTPKLVYELKKHLRIRLDKMTSLDIIHIEKRVMPSVEEIVNSPVIDTNAELPSASVAHGRRADHDTLPAEIRELWESNGARHQRIVVLFNELKAMRNAMPCDRYEKLVILDDLDKKYRSNLEIYDNYKVESSTSQVSEEVTTDDSNVDDNPSADSIPATSSEVTTDNSKTISAARKTLSKYRKLIAKLSVEDARYQTAIDKIQNSISTLIACGAGVSDETKVELSTLGIKFS